MSYSNTYKIDNLDLAILSIVNLLERADSFRVETLLFLTRHKYGMYIGEINADTFSHEDIADSEIAKRMRTLEEQGYLTSGGMPTMNYFMTYVGGNILLAAEDDRKPESLASVKSLSAELKQYAQLPWPSLIEGVVGEVGRARRDQSLKKSAVLTPLDIGERSKEIFEDDITALEDIMPFFEEQPLSRNRIMALGSISYCQEALNRLPETLNQRDAVLLANSQQLDIAALAMSTLNYIRILTRELRAIQDRLSTESSTITGTDLIPAQTVFDVIQDYCTACRILPRLDEMISNDPLEGLDIAI